VLFRSYTLPDFSDFFHLQAGDVVIWHHAPTAWPPNLTDYYYKDSITSSNITADTVIYEITRFKDNSITTEKQSFYRDNFSRFLNIHSAPGIFTNLTPLGDTTVYYIYCGSPRMQRKDNLFSMDLQWGNLVINPFSCTLGRLYDFGGYYSFDTRFGLSIINSVKAVGSIINGEKWGITTIPTGISTMDDLAFKVYPNPVSNKIMVQSKVAGKLDYRLFNSNGQMVKAGKVTNQTIGVAELPDGLYHLQVGNDKIQETKKIIKVN